MFFSRIVEEMTSSCGSLHVRLRCAADVPEKNTNQPRCKMLLLNSVLSNGLLTFKTYPRLSPVEKHHRSVTPTKLQKKVEQPKRAFWPTITWIYSGGSTNTKSPRGKHDAIQLRSTQLVALHHQV